MSKTAIKYFRVLELWYFVVVGGLLGLVFFFGWFLGLAAHTKRLCDHAEIDKFFSYFSLDGERSLKVVVLGDGKTSKQCSTLKKYS